MNNKIVIGCGAASVLGILCLVVAVWVAVVFAANEQPAAPQAAEPSPKPPAPQVEQGAQANSTQQDLGEDPGDDFEQMKRFKEGIEASRQNGEAPEQNVEDGVASRSVPSSGETVTLPSGLTVTAHSYTSPVQSDTEFWKPEAGKKFAVIDVEGCAGSNSGNDQPYLNPFDFSLQMPDNTRIGSTMAVMDPPLNHTDLLPGECVRGLVSFEVPVGQRPTYVRFDQMLPGEVAKWSID